MVLLCGPFNSSVNVHNRHWSISDINKGVNTQLNIWHFVHVYALQLALLH